MAKQVVLTMAVSISTANDDIEQDVLDQTGLANMAGEYEELEIYRRMEELHIIDLTISGPPLAIAQLAYKAGIAGIKLEVEESETRRIP